MDKSRALNWLFASALVVFAGICSPAGTRSGDWSVPGLSDPDTLVFVAVGALTTYTIVLFPLWVALGIGSFVPRFATGLLLCLVFDSVQCVRAHFRGHFDSPIIVISCTMAHFSLLAICFRWILRSWKWRIVACKAGSSFAPTPVYGHQFGIRHILEAMTLVAFLLALYRINFPTGFPDSYLWPKAIDWWRIVSRTVQLSFVFLVFLPTVPLPWLILVFRENGTTSFLAATSLLVCWIFFDCVFIWLVGSRGPLVGSEILWVQLGATAAGIVSATILRLCGYKIYRLECSQTWPL